MSDLKRKTFVDLADEQDDEDRERQASILNADPIVEDPEWDEQCRRQSQAYQEYVATCHKEGSPAMSQVQWLEKMGYFLYGCVISAL